MKEGQLPNIPDTWIPRIVIVGGGFGGLNLIKRLKGEKVQIILVDQNNYHTFQPLVYQVATAGLEPGAVSSSLRGLFEGQKNMQFRMAVAQSVNLDNYMLHTDQGKINYDYLVLANGSEANFFGNADIASRALTLNTLEDALTVKETFISNLEKAVNQNADADSALLRVVIVGGGPTGVELAGALAELKAHVLHKDYSHYDTSNITITLVEALDRLLPSMSEESGQKAGKYLDDLGVEIITGQMVEGFLGDVVRLADSRKLKAGLLVWSAGIKGRIIEGFEKGQIAHGGLKVDAFNRVVNTKDVFAVGNVACQARPDYPKGLPKLAPVAIQQGRHLAENIKRLLKKKRMKPFNYTNKGVMATIGRSKAVVELPEKIRFGGRLGWYVWVFVHLISIMGIRRKLVIMAHWIWSYFTFDKGNRFVLKKL